MKYPLFGKEVCISHQNPESQLFYLAKNARGLHHRFKIIINDIYYFN